MTSTDSGALICEGCGTDDPAELIFLTNASWAAVRCAPCAVYLLTSFDRMSNGSSVTP